MKTKLIAVAAAALLLTVLAGVLGLSPKLHEITVNLVKMFIALF